MSITITRHCHIQAPPDKVFAVITDFSRYCHWNPWIVSARGECRVGADVVVMARLGGQDSEYHHRILAIEAPTLFHWCDEGWFTRLAYGDRKRTLVANGTGTDYTVTLRVTGVMSWLVKLLYGRHLEKGMTLETEALKHVVEQQ